MIKAWWFNNRQKENDILQPDFFEPKTHFRIIADLPEISFPIEISVSAMCSDHIVFEKQFFFHENNANEVDGFNVDFEAKTVDFRALADTLAENPKNLFVRISTKRGEYTENIVCEYARIFGKTTDFQGNPFPSAIIFNRTGFEGFEDNLGVWSDSDGEYSVTIPKGDYNSFFVDDNTYGKTSLENWSWHMIVDRDEEHDFKIGNGEVYSLTLWTDNGGLPLLFVFFRPMALMEIKMKEYSVEISGESFPVFDINPEIDVSDIEVSINGQKQKNVSLQEILETNKERSLVAYILQIEKSAKSNMAKGKQTLILEYQSKKSNVKSQGRVQFYYSNSNTLAIR